MQEAIKDFGIRKAILVYIVKPWLKEGGHGAIKKCAEYVGVSPSALSQWYSVQVNQKYTKAPSPRQISRIATYMGLSETYMVKAAIMAYDKHEILSNSKPAIDAFKVRNNFAEARTHDPSPAHISNLKTFAGDGYTIYYLHMNDTNCMDIESFNIPMVPEPEESGYIELYMPRDGNLEDYTGTLIAPPELHRAFIFLEQKNQDGLFKDRGLIILYFPQDKVRQESVYQCGVGLMMSLHRTTRVTLFQRVVMLRNGSMVDEEYIREALERPLGTDSVISVSDLKDDQKELSTHVSVVPKTLSLKVKH